MSDLVFCTSGRRELVYCTILRHPVEREVEQEQEQQKPESKAEHIMERPAPAVEPAFNRRPRVGAGVPFQTFIRGTPSPFLLSSVHPYFAAPMAR